MEWLFMHPEVEPLPAVPAAAGSSAAAAAGTTAGGVRSFCDDNIPVLLENLHFLKRKYRYL